MEAVIATITDAGEVAKARLFPYQVWAAYKHAPSDDWKRALGRTMDLTTANVPRLDGTLVVIDTSGVDAGSAVRQVEADPGGGGRGHGHGHRPPRLATSTW